jgi:RNA polymerase sigma-70 factor (ECF subfamily)
MEEMPRVAEGAAQEDFAEFYRREYPAIVALAYALSGRAALAEDLAQDAFLATHRVWARVARYDAPGAFVRRVVANRAISSARRLVTEAKALTRLASTARPQLETLALPDVEFWLAVRSLPRRQAQALALRYLEDRSDEDIAAILRCSTSTVRVHLHRGRAALAHRLGLEETPNA